MNHDQAERLYEKAIEFAGFTGKETALDLYCGSGTITLCLARHVKTVYGDGNFGGLPVCAKSGTSQLGGDQKSNAMFAGFVDSDQYPLAFMVVVENGGYGSHTCVPVISKVLAACKSVMDN